MSSTNFPSVCLAVARRAQRVWPLLAAVGLSLGGCAAATRMDAQWHDPSLPVPSLQGASILMVCDSSEPVLQPICEDRLAEALSAQGASALKPLTPSGDVENAPVAPGAVPLTPDQQRAAAAVRAGAPAVLVVNLQPAQTTRSAPISIGIGGFGGGGHVGIGGGVSVPIGTRTQTAWGASARLLEAGSARLLWTGRATGADGDDAETQVRELADVLVSHLAEAAR